MGRRKRKLNWKYDETGTKCFVASLAGMHFWLYLCLDDRPKPYILDCPRYVRVGEYASWEEVEAAAIEHARPAAKKAKAELKAAGF